MSSKENRLRAIDPRYGRGLSRNGGLATLSLLNCKGMLSVVLSMLAPDPRAFFAILDHRGCLNSR